MNPRHINRHKRISNLSNEHYRKMSDLLKVNNLIDLLNDQLKQSGLGDLEAVSIKLQAKNKTLLKEKLRCRPEDRITVCNNGLCRKVCPEDL